MRRKGAKLPTMNATLRSAPTTWAFSLSARERMEQTEGRPLFRADWNRTVFLHYAVEPAALQPFVPFPLDVRDGMAYVSLVAFTMERMRLAAWPGRVSEWLLRPLSPCRYLNARAYVTVDGEPGIYFLAEWLSRQIPIPLGPLIFGLPYRAGRLDYAHDPSAGRIAGRVTDGRGRRLEYEGAMDPAAIFRLSTSGSLDEFLLERYTAFTLWRGRRRYFRIWHKPWAQTPVDFATADESLLSSTGAWAAAARHVGGCYSPRIANVWMGRPQWL